MRNNAGESRARNPPDPENRAPTTQNSPQIRPRNSLWSSTGCLIITLRLWVVTAVLAAFAILVLPAVFVGAGFLLSLVLSLSVFQCSVLSLGSAFLAALVFFAVSATPWAPVSAVYDEDVLDYDPFEYDEDEDLADFERTVDELLEPNAPSSSPKVGRNAPCICGSGKKFKNCCGKP